VAHVDIGEQLGSSRGLVTRRAALGVLVGGLAIAAWDHESRARDKHRGRADSRDKRAKSAEAGSGQLHINDFLAAQGSTNGFIPPIPDFIGWADNPQTHFASVDYAGLANGYLIREGYPSLGTKTSGTVTERSLNDGSGRAEVSVVLHTTKALTWVVALPADLATDPLDFGYRPVELLANAALRPALGRSELAAVFTNTAPGDPLPDLVDAFILENALPGQEWRSLKFRATADGALRSPFGVADGTPGRLTVTQTGLFDVGAYGADFDGFPAERVELRVVGR
jgi:hypothetical protein